MVAVRGDSGQEVYTTRNGAVMVEVWKLQERIRVTWLKREVAHPFGRPYLTVRRVDVGSPGLSDRGDSAVVTLPTGWLLQVFGPDDPEVFEVPPAVKGCAAGKGQEVRLPGL
jgi:hypothetical protein